MVVHDTERYDGRTIRPFLGFSMGIKNTSLVICLLILALLVSIPSAMAQPPSLPARYHGNVTVNENSAPIGTVIIAVMNGEEREYFTVEVEGFFGNKEPSNPNQFLVTGDYTEKNETVTFYTFDEKNNRYEAKQHVLWSPGDVKEIDLVFDIPSITPTSISSGGGTTTAATPAPVTVSILKVEKQVLAKITTGVPATLSFENVDVLDITINLKSDASNVEIEISKLSGKPTDITDDPIGIAYSYININTKNLNSPDIESATIQFKVENSWIEDNKMDPDTVKLNRYASNKWSELSTSKLSEDDKYMYYEAETPGFSYFAITGEKTEATPAPTVTVTPVLAPSPTPTATPTPSAPSELNWPIVIVGITAGVVIILFSLLEYTGKIDLADITKSWRKKEGGE